MVGDTHIGRCLCLATVCLALVMGGMPLRSAIASNPATPLDSAGAASTKSAVSAAEAATDAAAQTPGDETSPAPVEALVEEPVENQGEPGSQESAAESAEAPSEETPVESDGEPETAVSQETDDEADPDGAADEPADTLTPSVRVSGNIWRMNPGIVFLRTPIGLVTLSCKTCLRDLRGGPTVTLHVHGPHGAVLITPHRAKSPTRRYLWGPLTYAGPDKKTLRMWTPDGEEDLAAEPIAKKLAGLSDGHSINIEVNEQGKILGLHQPLQYDLQVSQLPARPGDTELTLSGSVSKIKNGYVHVKTEVGMLPISGKVGLCRKKRQCEAQVGQDVTLWIHETTMVIDLYETDSSTVSPTLSTRLLSGKVTYAGPDKQTLSLWTPDGEQVISVDEARAALGSLKEGTPLVVEMDAAGSVQSIRAGG